MARNTYSGEPARPGVRAVPCWFGLLVPWLVVSFAGVAIGEPGQRGRGLAEQLTVEGWAITAGAHVLLPESDLVGESTLTADLLDSVAGRRGWSRFAAESRLAPVNVVIEPQEVDGERVGHLVTAAFVLRAPRAVFADDAEAEAALGLKADSPDGAFRPLTAEECAAAGVTPATDGSERLAFVELTLLNRVVVRGVIRAERQETDRGLSVAWAFDHRFDGVPELQATSARLTVNDLGERVREPAEPYAGAAGMVVARELTAPERAAAGHAADDPPVLVVQSRLLVAEPEAWFGGSNLLRAKIPLITQEGVRDLRRRLEAER